MQPQSRSFLKGALQEAAQFEGRSVLVVGGAGYIGSVLVRKLLKSGARVRVLDSLVYGDAALREVIGHPRLELMVGDCRNISTVVRATQGVDAVVQLAAIVGDPACDQDRTAAVEINYAATQMMAEVMKGNGNAQMVFASSCSVYGCTDEMSSEESPVNPISLYARTKIDSEVALLHSRSDTFHPTILRFATVFGLSPRPRFDLVVNLLAAKTAGGEPITIFNGQQWRPFIHVCDAARSIACVLAAPLSAVSGEIFNVGDEAMNFTLAQLADKIGDIFPEACVEYVDNSDRRDYRVSFDKILSRLGFHCAHDLEHGVREIKEAVENGKISSYTDPIYHNQKYLKLVGSLANTSEFDALLMAAFASRTIHESAATLTAC
jgi:nucleoside-diphosphate-sugar epimerase